MKKFKLFNIAQAPADSLGLFGSKEEASDYAIAIMAEAPDSFTVFDFDVKEVEYKDPTEIVKTYEDACDLLGIEPLDEDDMEAVGFRRDEIARRKLETIAEALNEGWKPDWNDTTQDKYAPWFWIKPNQKEGATYAGLANALASNVPAYTNASLGSRLCFKTRHAAAYAADQFKDLYALILVELF